MMADQSGVLLVLASIVLLAFIGRLVWWAFRSSSVYKKAFAAWQGTASFAFLESNRHSMEALFANLKDSLQNVDGDVLELAIGSGGNLQFYPPGTSLIATDINPNVEERLLATLKQFPHVTLKKFLAGNVLDGVGVEDESVAAVVCTKFLCNLNDKEALKVLREVKRILKPGGRFVFLEHVADKPGTLRRKLQDTATSTGLWSSLFDGCMCNKETSHVLHNAGFHSLSYKSFFCISPSPYFFVYYFVRPHIMGYAQV